LALSFTGVYHSYVLQSRTMGRVPSAPSPSPNKLAKPYTLPRPASPTKPPSHPHLNGRPTHDRVPSSSTFNPTIPKTPAYPVRLPRRDESMLSLNGSPLANPYELGLGWFAGVEGGEHEVKTKSGDGDSRGGRGRSGLKKSKSIINIRRDPSLAHSHTTTHSRTNSNSTNPQSNHSRSNSNTQQTPHSQPPPQYQRQGDATPRPFPTTPAPGSYHPVSALVAIPTSDGHLLEFDPLQTSPGALDALDGITDSAKKGAREEMGRLVKMAVERWKIV
jgi:hypothetical protein